MSLKSVVPVRRDIGLASRQSFDPITALQKEVERLFQDFGRGFSWSSQLMELTPSMDVTESDKTIEITAELPGLQEKDVQVNVSDNILTIKGEKKAEKEEKDTNYRLVERSYGSFLRSIELPQGTDAESITASISNGVLTVTVPKAAPAQVKNVAIKSAA